MKHQTKKIVTVFFLFIHLWVRADEGMWLPHLLAQLNEKQMKAMGMKISAADIYSVNKGSLKDAIVHFNGGCTGEVISTKGLVLTNHHCGFDAIQNHSTLDHNYIRDGFWARNSGEELPNQGLYVTFIVRIEDVTKKVLAGVPAGISEKERQSLIDKNIGEARKNVAKESYQESFIRAFYEGNQYILFITETFRDIRLVGAPPSSIGNFGKDTDNWMWPRHTGDFSLFRIYAGKDNKPAPYSKDNVPYVPGKALSISLNGVKENDFTMVFGFPGRTSQYLHSSAVEQIMTVNDPAKIAIREKALTVLDGLMRKDEQIKIMYAAKYAGIQNAYKKWQGEVMGLTATGAVAKKKKFEEEFKKRVASNKQWSQEYGSLLGGLEVAYAKLKEPGFGRDYFSEVVGRIELFSIASQLRALLIAYEQDGENGLKQKQTSATNNIRAIYEEYHAETDQRLFEVLIEMFVKNQPERFVSPELKQRLKQAGNDYNKLATELYQAAGLKDVRATMEMLKKDPPTLIAWIKNNPAVMLYNDLVKTYQTNVQPDVTEHQSTISQLQRQYMKAQMELFPEKTFYPDANSTMRLTYGRVQGYKPRDAVRFDYYSYLDGVIEKYKPGDYEFDLPEKLRTLYQKKDYGPYGVGGKMPVCFIAMNHTTGGNSGSPALDAYGNLVGLNFDRVWEGTMSDINYNPSICRNIMVDIRYVLFIIDKYADAGYLVHEMKLVKGPAKR